MATRHTRTDGIVAFVGVSCAWTWALALPLAQAWHRRESPAGYAVACAGLSAFGPLIAALVIAAPQRRVTEIFSRWRTKPVWIGLALLTPAALHLGAAALAAVVGFAPSRWFHPPSTGEQVAALIVFPLGEELGWRGFAYPRLVERYGTVEGSLLLGTAWGVWHLMYSVTPGGAFDVFGFALGMVELPLYSVLIAWVFERANRSMAVAIAFHAGAHLDHIELAPHSDVALHVAHVAVLVLLAAGAARALRQRPVIVRSHAA